MPKVNGPVVGISFAEEAIYAVATRPGPGGAAQVWKVGTSPLPKGSIENGEVREPALLAAAIKAMLQKHAIPTTAAIIGLPSRATLTRTLAIPPVPEKERRAVVRGEIDHLNILPPGQGAFDFVPLARAEGSQTKGDPLLFFAAERGVVEGYRTVAQEAGLRVVGMEPSDFAAIRAIYPGLAEKPLSLAISLGGYHTDLLFFQNGSAVYARRLDIGIQQMTVPELNVTPTGAPGGWQMVDTWEAPNAEQVNQGAEQMAGELFGDKIGKAGTAREALALEIGRSLEYFRRDYAAAIEDIHIALLPNNLDLAGLPIYITAALEQDVHFVYAFEHVQTAGDLPARFLQEEGVAYAPALGLTLGPLGGRFSGAPYFDLSVEDANVIRARQAPRRLTVALAVSLTALLLGVTGSIYLAQRHAPVKEDLAAARQELALLTQQEQTVLAQRQQQRDLVNRIRSQNISWTNVLRYLGQAIPPGVGITNLSMQGQTSLSLSGVTRDQRNVPTVWSMMNNSPFFTGADVPSITINDQQVTFQMTVGLPAPPPPASPAAPGASGSSVAGTPPPGILAPIGMVPPASR